MWGIGYKKYYQFFVAKDQKGSVLATLGTYRFKGVATEIMSHRSKGSFDNNLPAQDLLHWEIIKYHKSLGDHWFNLAGYSPNPNTPKEEGIRNFKKKWGGQEIPVHTYILDLSSFSMRMARKLKSMFVTK